MSLMIIFNHMYNFSLIKNFTLGNIKGLVEIQNVNN